MESTKFLAVAAVITVSLFVSNSWALQCYKCSGDTSSLDLGSTRAYFCGLPLNYNETAAATQDTDAVRIVDCPEPGVCVSQTTYDGNSSGSTIVRSCTHARISDGCERMVQSDSHIRWTCISTCTTNLCNDKSDATSPIPHQLTTLLLLSIVASIFRRSV
jgi:hypothetical protein